MPRTLPTRPSVRLRCCCCVLLALFVAITRVHAQPLDGANLRQTLDSLIDNHPTSQRTSICLRVVDLASDQVLYDRNGDLLLTPASNLKIYTTACALGVFDPSKRFTTRVVLEGVQRDGTLLGDVVLLGGGDSMLSSKDLASIAGRVVREFGLRRIEGTVRVDNSRYGSPLKGPGWMWDDDPDYYNMSITPLMMDFNVLRVRLTLGEEGTFRAQLLPSSKHPRLQFVAGESGAEARIERLPFEEAIRVVGSNLKETVERRMTMHDPAPWVSSVFRQMLEDAGIEFVAADGEPPVHFRAKDGATSILVHKGPTLEETLKHFNEKSENSVGEVLLHEVAIQGGVKHPKWTAGARLISEWLWRNAGLTEGSFRIVDGSGLSRYNLICAESSTTLLASMHKGANRELFANLLPTYEVQFDRDAWPQPISESKLSLTRVRAKTGSMSGVLNVSGYVETIGGRHLAFSFLANGFIGSSQPLKELRQEVWNSLVRYRP